jgi:hypothetical protein
MNWANQLGRLEQVPLRSIWRSESSDFTPWLAHKDNIAILSDSIGLDLEVEAQEKDVGPFRADILCKDTARNNWVLIENQLEKTDHTHLGQLMTYASGLKAVTIVWIAEKFTDEHRAALDWLNQITSNDFNFFGLEIELWKIGDSAVAPKFNIVSKPNDWSREVAAGAGKVELEALTETKRLQLAFWGFFKEYVDKNGKKIRATKPLPQHWMNFALGRSGFKMCAIASKKDSETDSFEGNELRAEVIVETVNSKEDFKKLENDKDTIESELGEKLFWYNPDGKRMCSIYLRKPVENLFDETRWGEYSEWLMQKLELLHRVFSQRVKQI